MPRFHLTRALEHHPGQKSSPQPARASPRGSPQHKPTQQNAPFPSTEPCFPTFPSTAAIPRRYTEFSRIFGPSFELPRFLETLEGGSRPHPRNNGIGAALRGAPRLTSPPSAGLSESQTPRAPKPLETTASTASSIPRAAFDGFNDPVRNQRCRARQGKCPRDSFG